jgi:hypothetical protein
MTENQLPVNPAQPRSVPARWVLPLWPIQPPLGISDSDWLNIQRLAHLYVCSSIPVECHQQWGPFVLGTFAASQPRNIPRVQDRLSALLTMLTTSGATLDENVEVVVSEERRRRFLMSEHVTRLDSGSRQHVSRALTAMAEAVIGNPRSCSIQSRKKPDRLIPRIQAATQSDNIKIRQSALQVLKWITDPNPSKKIPRNDAVRLCRWMTTHSERVLFEDLRAERLVELSIQPIPGFLILQEKPNDRGFANALINRNPTLDSRHVRLGIERTNEITTSSESS